MKEFLNFMSGAELAKYNREIAEQNRMAIRYLVAAGIPVSIASIAAQTIIKGAPSLMWNGSWMLIYFLLLALASAYVIPKDCPHATLIVYLLEAPVLVVSILLGTVWDPNHQALTYLMFMLLMPIFVLDRPIRVIGVMALWNVVFLLLCFTVKNPATRQGDVMHVLEFYLSSIAVMMVVLKLRFEVIHGYELNRYHLGHDSLTGAQNRPRLEAKLDSYLNKPLLILMGDLDQLALINDQCGRDYGDKVLTGFSRVLSEAFGHDQVYRFGGDEMLCVVPGGRAEQCLPLLEKCREQMTAAHEEAYRSFITCSFSYVTGCPKDSETFRKMIQLAEIQVHKLSKLGQGGTLGCAFDDAALRAAIVESNISTHLHAYETNKLTGLPGVEYFISHCEELVDTLVSMDRNPVIGFINPVHFQAFNDTYGYARGDELVHELVRLLREAFPSRHLAYISSGRFGVMCYCSEAEEGVRHVNEGLRAYMPDAEVEVKAGFAEYRRGDSVLSLLDKAKLSHDSIYAEKGVDFRLYDDKLDQERRFRQYLISHLDEAIEKGWIKVYGQPIIRTITGEICAMEALARWDDPNYGFLPPIRFIGALEEERLIYKLNLHMVSQVIRGFRHMEELGLPLVPVSVNLSRRDFLMCDMVQRITAMMDSAGYPHSLLKLEITESAFMENPALLKQEVDRFHMNGFEVWMDDFGSEYSTLNLLHELNFDLVKIDMQFMKNFSASGRNSIIVDDIIGMCKRLGITPLVEGVETREQLDALTRMGCEMLQGFFFARPMSSPDFHNQLQAGSLPRLEEGSQAEYHSRLGRIDLHSPLARPPREGETTGRSVPAGIVELKGDYVRLVRGNESMYELARLKAVSVVENQTVRLDSLHPMIAEALRQVTSDAWASMHGVDTQGHDVSFYGRRITEGPNGEVAVLLVILPG